MSCWRRYSCDVLKNVDKDLLHEACKELGFNYDESIKEVSNTWGEDKVDAGFIRDGKELPLGFIFEKNPDPFNNKVSVTVAGDFWSTGFNEATFVDTLSQLYQKHNVITQLEANGFIVNSIETNAEDEIEIEAYAYA